jgi:hypothetical protein
MMDAPMAMIALTMPQNYWDVPKVACPVQKRRGKLTVNNARKFMGKPSA